VIVTGSAERTRVVAELARELELPYVEFSFAFVKGNVDDGDGPSSDIPLTQVWLSLGGYNSIFSFQRVIASHIETLSLAQYLAHKDMLRKSHRSHSPWTPLAPYSALDAVPGEFNQLLRDLEDEDSFGDGGWECLQQAYCYGLRAAADSSIETNAMLSLAFEHDQQVPSSLEYLPGGSSFDEASSARAKAQPWHAEAAAAAALRKDEVRPILDALKEKMEKELAKRKEAFRVEFEDDFEDEDDFENGWEEYQFDDHEAREIQRDKYGCVDRDPTLAEDDGDHGVAAPAGAWLFHRDEHGKTCFNEAEARAACELIAAIKLDERVVAAMADTEFVFPQEHASTRDFVCNGETYGEFELLQVTGVVRLEAKPELVKAAKEEEVARRKERREAFLRQEQKREAEEAERNAKRARIAAGEEVEEEEAEEEESAEESEEEEVDGEESGEMSGQEFEDADEVSGEEEAEDGTGFRCVIC